MSRGTLKCFSFGSYKGVNTLPEDVLGLFLSLADKPDKPVEYTEEIINAALDGRIDLSKDFNLDGYTYRIKTNAKMNEEKSKKKIAYIDFSGTDEDRQQAARTGGVNIDTVSAVIEMEEAFESIVENDELQYAVESIKALRNDFLIDEGVDIVVLLSKAVRGIPQAIEKLKSLCSNYELVGEQIQVILESGVQVDACFA